MDGRVTGRICRRLGDPATVTSTKSLLSAGSSVTYASLFLPCVQSHFAPTVLSPSLTTLLRKRLFVGTYFSLSLPSLKGGMGGGGERKGVSIVALIRGDAVNCQLCRTVIREFPVSDFEQLS